MAKDANVPASSIESDERASAVTPLVEAEVEQVNLAVMTATVSATPEANSIKTGSLFLPQVGASGIRSTEDYIYWTQFQSSTAYRYPLSGGDVELFIPTLHQSPEGVILELDVDGDWLLALDAEYAAVYSPFALRAFNLQTGEEKIILEDESEQTSTPIFAVSDNWVVWSRIQASGEESCSAYSTLAVQNLIRDELRELDRSCVDDNYMWNITSGIGISKNKVVAIKQLADSQGGGRQIVLFDIDAGTSEVISGRNRHNSLPAISGKWAAWKVYPDDGDISPETPDFTVLLNLESGEQREFHHGIGLDDPILQNERWLYWQNLGATPWQTVYDLSTGKEYRFTTEVDQQSADALTTDWQIQGHTIVWVNSLNDDPADPRTGDYLYWRTGESIEGILAEGSTQNTGE